MGITEILKERYVDKEIDIYLIGHIYFSTKNSACYDGKKETTEWSLASLDTKTVIHEGESWSKFRTIKSKTVKVLEVIWKCDYEGSTWKLRCQGKKGKEYIVPIPE